MDEKEKIDIARAQGAVAGAMVSGLLVSLTAPTEGIFLIISASVATVIMAVIGRNIVRRL